MIPVEIPPNTVMLKGIGWDSDIYLVRDGDEALIIDTGTGTYWNRYAEVWEREGYLNGVRRAVIFNTHEHFDHVGGNSAIRGWLERRGIKVLFAAHRKTAEVLEGQEDYVILSFYYGRRYEAEKISFKLRDGDVLKIGALRFELMHTPGHTAGSSCLYEPGEKLLFTGDTVFKGTVGRTDLPTGSRTQLAESIRRLEGLDVYLGLPGHGGLIRDWEENLRTVKGMLGL
ncbi:MBL fold metallo-hydrolase [Thermococcus sp.]